MGRVLIATPPTDPQPTPGTVTEILAGTEVTITSKKGKTTHSVSKVTVGPKKTPGTKPKEPARPANPWQIKPNELVGPPQTNQSPIDEISELVGNLPFNECVELTRRILTSVPTLLLGQLARGLSSKSSSL